MQIITPLVQSTTPTKEDEKLPALSTVAINSTKDSDILLTAMVEQYLINEHEKVQVDNVE